MTGQGVTFAVLGEPSGLQYGVTPRTDKRTFLKLPVPYGTRDVNTGVMQFAGPQHEDVWGLYWMAQVSRCCVQLQPPPQPGQPTAFGFPVVIQNMGAMSTLGTLTDVWLQTPEVTPVTGITINGDPLDALGAPRMAVGLTPTIAWTAPAAEVKVYTVIIQHLYRFPDGTMDRAAIIDTAATSLVVPPGVLVAGNAYSVTIRATKRGMDATRPVRMDLPTSSASITGGQWFTP
jgi:hypothetical protein